MKSPTEMLGQQDPGSRDLTLLRQTRSQLQTQAHQPILWEETKTVEKKRRVERVKQNGGRRRGEGRALELCIKRDTGDPPKLHQISLPVTRDGVEIIATMTPSTITTVLRAFHVYCLI